MDTRIRAMHAGDPTVLEAAFAAIGWHKPAFQYERYLAEAARGERLPLVAEVRAASDAWAFAGYVTVVWQSAYEPFRSQSIPEIVDLNVLPEYRRRGVGSRLLDAAEEAIGERSPIAGIGVGLYPDYGPAQRMYVLRGYVPDARGVCYDGVPVEPFAPTVNDDSLNLHFTRRLR